MQGTARHCRRILPSVLLVCFAPKLLRGTFKTAAWTGFTVS
jgi:hypothetical protein